MFRLSQKSRTMIDAIGGLRALLKWESLRADNFVFRLHYKVSFGCLLMCSFIVSAKQYVGDPIGKPLYILYPPKYPKTPPIVFLAVMPIEKLKGL